MVKGKSLLKVYKAIEKKVADPNMTLSDKLDIYIASYKKISNSANKIAKAGKIGTTIFSLITIFKHVNFQVYKGRVQAGQIEEADLKSREEINLYLASLFRSVLYTAGSIFITRKAQNKKDLFETYATGFTSAKSYADKLSALKLTLLDAKSKFIKMLQVQKGLNKDVVKNVEDILISIDSDLESIATELSNIKKLEAKGEVSLLKIRSRNIKKLSNVIDESRDAVDLDSLSDDEVLMYTNTILHKYKNEIDKSITRASYLRVFLPMFGVAIFDAHMVEDIIKGQIASKGNIKNLKKLTDKLNKASFKSPVLAKETKKILASTIATLKYHVEKRKLSDDEVADANNVIDYLTLLNNALTGGDK